MILWEQPQSYTYHPRLVAIQSMVGNYIYVILHDGVVDHDFDRGTIEKLLYVRDILIVDKF